MKQKICKLCKNKFTPQRQLQSTCSFDCAIEYSKVLEAKRAVAKKTAERVALREFKKNDKVHLKELAQKLVNRYARLRDFKENGLRCVTCSSTTGKRDGGHFLPTSGYSAIRYNTNQLHQQCVCCNMFNGGRPKEYRIFMINKYGLKYVESLEQTKNITRSYSVEYYQKLIRVVRKKIARL